MAIIEPRTVSLMLKICSLLLPRQVETKAKVADLHKIEARLDIDELAATLAATAQEYRLG